MPRLLVTGGSGFVGSALLARLHRAQWPVLGVTHRTAAVPHCATGPALERGADWSGLVGDCDVVIHTAARVHVMQASASDALSKYRMVNVDGTLELARQSAAAGVRRFVFISSIKVNGESTVPGRPFTAHGDPSPQDAYAISKAEAEAGLAAVAAQTGMEVVVIRPPLVYGVGAKANFLTMMQWLRRRIPLPLGSIEHNRRSLVALDNLVDLIVTCIDHPAAGNQVFLAADGEDLSTADLLRRLGAAMGVPVRLLPVPMGVLRAGARLTGKDAIFRRLTGDLQVDISGTQARLGWYPPVPVDEGLRRAVVGLRS